jgi:hypothetical protein
MIRPDITISRDILSDPYTNFTAITLKLSTCNQLITACQLLALPENHFILLTFAGIK